MVDFHAHILPEADHGSDGLETSLYQLEQAVNAGIDTILATPHFYLNNDNVDDFLERRENSFVKLEKAAQEKNINIKIIKGAEVNLQTDLMALDCLEKLCIEGTRYMLLEPPMFVPWTKWVYDSVDCLRNMEIEPIIAHIDRYSTFHIEQMFVKNVICQVNASALTDRHYRRRFKKLLYSELVHLVGSDIHMNGNQYTAFKKMAHKLPAEFGIMSENANSIFRNEWL